MKLYFFCPLPRVSFWFSSFLFYFGSTLLFCFVLTLLLRLPLFLLVLQTLHPVIYLYLRCPAVNVFFPFVGFAGYIWFSILFALLFNVCPLFAWALRAVFISYVICPAVIDLPSLWALRAIFLFGLYFTLLLTSALFSRGLCRQFLFQMLFALLFYALLPTFALFSCGLCGQF